ncbi:MAG: helix-turn-helix domain-containing protein [Pseudomonadota bacterium]
MRKPRADATAHREVLLAAADAVFSKHGVMAALDLVVTHAGVGRATLYRNFPHRTALMEALLDRALCALETYALTIADRCDALFLLFERFGQNIASSSPLVDFWRAVDRTDPIVQAARRRIAKIFKQPLQRAIDDAACRPDLRIADVLLMCNMLGASLRGGSVAERRGLARRALQLLRIGIDSPPASPDASG